MPGEGSIILGPHRGPAGTAPFNGANNGLSVDPITGMVVLGDDIGGILSTLLSDREIPLDTHFLRFSETNGDNIELSGTNLFAYRSSGNEAGFNSGSGGNAARLFALDLVTFNPYLELNNGFLFMKLTADHDDIFLEDGLSGARYLDIDTLTGQVLLGDTNAFGNSIRLLIDDGTESVTIFGSIIGRMLDLDFSNDRYQMGDIDNILSGILVDMNGITGEILFSLNNNPGLDIDMGSRVYKMGDINGVGNGTMIHLIDSTQQIRLKDGSLATASNGFVWTLINQGTGQGGWAATNTGSSFVGAAQNAAITPAVTGYVALGGLATTSATESTRVIPMPAAGTFTILKVNFVRPAAGAGTVTFTVRKNGAGTALTVADATSGGATVLLSVASNVAFAANDLISLEIVSTYAGASGTLQSFSIGYQ